MAAHCFGVSAGKRPLESVSMVGCEHVRSMCRRWMLTRVLEERAYGAEDYVRSG